MGCLSHQPDDPLGVQTTLAVARHLPGLHAAGIANPMRNDPEFLRLVEKALAAGQVKALQVYLGYLHFAPDHDGYRPYYELAARRRAVPRPDPGRRRGALPRAGGRGARPRPVQVVSRRSCPFHLRLPAVRPPRARRGGTLRAPAPPRTRRARPPRRSPPATP